MSTFALQMKKFENLTEKKAEAIFKGVCFELSSKIIVTVPTDEGRAKGSFFPEINSISKEVNAETDTDKSGAKSKAKVKAVTNRLKIGNYFSLTSNLDYIIPLEYGLYPNPPKRGSPIKGTKNPVKYEILTTGGFSKKAPAGMIAISVRDFKNIVDITAKATK